MTTFQAIIYGIVQGLTEFLPISSTAHLILLPWAAGWPDPGLSFDVALHLGTLVALLIYFRADWIALISSALGIIRGRTQAPGARMVMQIVVATIPGAIAGALFEHKVEDALRAPQVIALMLIALALVLVVAELMGRRKKSLNEISWGDAIAVGVAQAFAIIPGVSRSGVTITAGLFRGLKRDAAARFSFYLSTPIIAGAVGKRSLEILKAGATVEQLTPFIVGILASGIVGYLAIAFLMRYLQTHTTYLFVYYRVALGIAVLLAIWTGIR
ncbi:MAG TPA: undecaprenyl-diphosphatase UppP [Terriglobia bacterium]|nr:undecaprenyl-diphosphatase UppP [Terriglobia bacterium]